MTNWLAPSPIDERLLQLVSSLDPRQHAPDLALQPHSSGSEEDDLKTCRLRRGDTAGRVLNGHAAIRWQAGPFDPGQIRIRVRLAQGVILAHDVELEMPQQTGTCMNNLEMLACERSLSPYGSAAPGARGSRPSRRGDLSVLRSSLYNASRRANSARRSGRRDQKR